MKASHAVRMGAESTHERPTLSNPDVWQLFPLTLGERHDKCHLMDGATNTTTEKLIQLDIADAAYRLWAERYDELICSGKEYGHGPSEKAAWDTYVERGAHNYPWWFSTGELNTEGRGARARFIDAFADGPGIYGMRGGLTLWTDVV